MTQKIISRAKFFCLSDGVALMILGAGIFARGVSYIPRGPRGAVSHPAEAALPMSVWAAVWVAIGALCLATALWAESRLAAVALGLGVGLNLLWAGSFFATSLTGDMPRGWVSAVGYLSTSALVMWSTWRGSRLTTMREEGGGGEPV